MLEEEKVETSKDKEGEVIDVEKATKAKAAMKKYIHDKVVEANQISDANVKILEEMLEEADMPVVLKNEEFKLGKQELDIRKLNKQNREQILFRISTLNAVYLRNISKSLIDLTNLFFVLLDKMGVENILKASDDVLDKIAEEDESLKKIAKAVKEAKNEQKN